MGYKTFIDQQKKNATTTNSISIHETTQSQKPSFTSSSQTDNSSTKDISAPADQTIHYKILRKQLESLILEKFKINQQQIKNLIITTEHVHDNTLSQKEQAETILQEMKLLSNQLNNHRQQFIKKDLSDIFQTKILLVAIYMSIVSTAFIAKQLFHIDGLWSWLKVLSGFKVLIE